MHALAAAQGQSTNSTPPIPNSDSNYLDDTLEWNMPVYIHPTGSSGVDLSSTFCLPANTPVIGLDSKYTTGTPPSSETVAGLSYGIGLMGTIKDSFNISLVFGADHASSKTYQYQDKPWASFAPGYSFTKYKGIARGVAQNAEERQVLRASAPPREGFLLAGVRPAVANWVWFDICVESRSIGVPPVKLGSP